MTFSEFQRLSNRRCGEAFHKGGGKGIRFCWNSCGIGANRGFDIKRVLLICHGAAHNDTIVTIGVKHVG